MPTWRTRIAGCSASSRTARNRRRYAEVADRLTESLEFMRAIGLDAEAPSGTAPDRLLHLARGAAARLRAGDDARRFDERRPLRHLGPHDVDRRPHAPARRRPCRVLPRREEPDRAEMRPVADGRRAAQADRHPQPGRRGRAPDADLPLRRRQGRRPPAGPDPRRGARGPHRRVVLRPDARQHHQGVERLQDPALRPDHERDPTFFAVHAGRGDLRRAACISR